MKKLFFLIAVAIFAFSAKTAMATPTTDKGFDEFGYNRTARIFNGTAMGWCLGKIGDQAWCDDYLGIYANDKLVMKWNAEWDRGNDEGWSNGPYNAWEDNEWNGAFPGGSGETWHYKIKWIGEEEGSIWGQFETIMSHGTVNGVHIWDIHNIPNGYGTN